MPHIVDVYWSFRSPYSYLACQRLVALADEYKIDFQIRPVLPIAVRIKGFFTRVNPLWAPYLMKDTARVAQQRGLPYRWPRPDPVVMDLKSGEVPEDQPFIHRLTALGQLAAERGRGLAFVHEVSSVIWSGRVDDWHLGDHLAGAAQRAGLDLAVLDAHVLAEGARLNRAIEDNQKALQTAGHWGVPTFVYNGEAFFGQDRIETLMWRLRSEGLKHRDNKPITPEFLHGAWQLDRWELWQDGQFKTLPLGDHGRGFLHYMPDGRMSGFLQHTDWPRADAQTRPSPVEFLSYCGTWTLDGHDIVHQVDAASIGAWVGTALRRRARRTSSDGLELSVPEVKDAKGRSMSNILRWRRR